MFFYQTGQIVPGTLLSIGLASGLGVTASPAITAFVEKAELASLTYAQSALKSSLQINHLLSRLSSNKLIIDGREVTLKFGYPIADKNELEKVASFGTQELINSAPDTVIISSPYKSWCFVYKAADNTKPAEISEILMGTNSICKY